MSFNGQPVATTVTHISQLKVSDGKSVQVTVPAETGVVAGNFYVIDGFFGAVLKTVKAEDNTAGTKVALQLEPCEYITDQILVSKTFAMGAELYYNKSTKKFTDEAAAGLLLVGKVSAPKDGANTIQFIRYPQVTEVQAAEVSGGEG